MDGVTVLFAAALLPLAGCSASWQPIPTVPIDADGPDWLVHLPVQMPAPSLLLLDNRTVALTNGLLARVFTFAPDWATWDIQTARGSAIRAVSPEGFVSLDGVRCTCNCATVQLCTTLKQ